MLKSCLIREQVRLEEYLSYSLQSAVVPGLAVPGGVTRHPLTREATTNIPQSLIKNFIIWILFSIVNW